MRFDWFCANCRTPRLLNRHGRCECCDSDAITPIGALPRMSPVERRDLERSVGRRFLNDRQAYESRNRALSDLALEAKLENVSDEELGAFVRGLLREAKSEAA